MTRGRSEKWLLVLRLDLRGSAGINEITNAFFDKFPWSSAQSFFGSLISYYFVERKTKVPTAI